MADAFICDYSRTPIGRYGGAFASVRADDLAAHPIAALIERNPGLDPAAIEDGLSRLRQSGRRGQPQRRAHGGAARGPARDRARGHGQPALRLGHGGVAAAARAIRAGDVDVAIAGGVESMTRAPFVMPKAETAFVRTAAIYDTTIGWRFVNPKMQARYGTDSMGETAENVAQDFRISRADQDAFALRSQQKAARAMADGRFAAEIGPVVVPPAAEDPRGRRGRASTHRHPLEDLAKLRPLPPEAAPSPPATPRAQRRRRCAAHRLGGGGEPARPRRRSPASSATRRRRRAAHHGQRPGPGDRRSCSRGAAHQSTTSTSWSSTRPSPRQALACSATSSSPTTTARVNVNGGAIALGHPLGMSGARIGGTAASELAATDGRLALATMCVGVGQGTALLIERV